MITIHIIENHIPEISSRTSYTERQGKKLLKKRKDNPEALRFIQDHSSLAVTTVYFRRPEGEEDKS
jgi:hypothetical protein